MSDHPSFGAENVVPPDQGSSPDTRDMSPSPLDGNAIAGPLMEIFSVDLTNASGRCDHCGSVRHLAEAVVFMDAPGHVVRCRSCDGILMRLVVSDDRMWLDLRGLSYLQVPRAR